MLRETPLPKRVVLLVTCAWLLGGHCLCGQSTKIPPNTRADVRVRPFPFPRLGQSIKTPPNPRAAPSREQVTFAHIVLETDHPEGPQPPGLFSASTESLDEILSRIDRAAQDPAISGLVLRLENPQIGWGRLHEVRAALERFRKTGKKAYAQLELALLHDYLLASACDEIVAPPSGMLMLTGLSAEVTFYKGLLDKLGIEADLMTIGDFKGSAEPLTRSELSPKQRSQMNVVLDDYWDQVLQQIAEARGIPKERVEKIMDEGPFTPARAQELGLLDAVAYEDEFAEQVRLRHDAQRLLIAKDYGKKSAEMDFSGLAGLVKMMNLLMGISPAERPTAGPKIAVIYARGLIVPGEGDVGLISGELMGAETIMDAIHTAEQDAQVSAIVMRVDSRGGSALASDLIWREVVRAKKPFVVSMGDTAASGGYYISMGADRIVAEPGTLTGSIGIIGGKIALRGLYEQIGITTETLRRGKNAGALSLNDPFSPSERQAILRMMNDQYDQFVRKAAQGRKMDRAKLEPLAGGRVWTGRLALASGLVDKLGTLQDAIAEAKQLAGMKPDDEVELLRLPRPKNFLEQLMAVQRNGVSPFAFRTWSTKDRFSLGQANREVAGAPGKMAEWSLLLLGTHLSGDWLSRRGELQTLDLLVHEPVLVVEPFTIRLK